MLKKLLLYLTPLVLASIILVIFIFYINNNSGKGALQVTSVPKADVYLNDKLIGQTPLCKCDLSDMISVGDYTVRLVPKEDGFSPFEEKIKITKSILTVVDRTFGKAGNSEGSVISLVPLTDSKKTELMILSFPDNARVLLDNNSVGNTPLLLKDITESDHEIRLVKDGYTEKMIKIRTVAGYKLTLLGFLGVNLSELSAPVVLTITPTPIVIVSKIKILQTQTGFLRVRETGSLNSAEIGKAYPGEEYEIIKEENGWFEIKFKDVTGWVNSQYVAKQ
ncbi:MAG: PEGA domain-containing protein [Patescibacteria group bacterium]|nr:PEGA domain-containing protein [Patescibacteria group bacterium]